MAFTEFCCRSGGSNLNAGTRTGNSTEPSTAAAITYLSGTWVQATRTFTPAGGANPTADGVAVGDFVSIYPDAATVTPYVARITTVGSTTFETSATAKSGTAPVDGVLNTSAKIGGAWKGPNGAETFPINFVTTALTNATGSLPCINIKNDATQSVTVALTSNAGVYIYGYSASYRDGGKATIDGGVAGASYVLFTAGARSIIGSIVFNNNGSTGNSNMVALGQCIILACVFSNSRGPGCRMQSGTVMHECEAFSNVQVGFRFDSGGKCVRCVSHDNTSHGFSDEGFGGGPVVLYRCIAESNGGRGIKLLVNAGNLVSSCEVFGNTSHGLELQDNGNFGTVVENSNFLSNGGYGIANATGSGSGVVLVSRNNGFGAGTKANTSGTIQNTIVVLDEAGTVTYAADVTPWVDPTNGDFRINLATAKGAGRGAFTQTAASYAGTVGYPDIGAAQHLESGSSGGNPNLLTGLARGF